MRKPVGSGRRTAQAGVAAILLLVVLVMGALYALLSGVNTATAELDRKRDDRTADALKQAKEALIAWSARLPNQPGALPCPDTNDDGYADTDSWPGDGAVDVVPTPDDDVTRHNSALAGAYCSTPARRAGRLPWRTLGLPDLRDSSGERLWYAISDSFRVLGVRRVNSDTQGQLTVAGIAPATNIVAIVFAPSSAITTAGLSQARAGAASNDVMQYLEASDKDGNGAFDADDVFAFRSRCEQTDCPAGAFNDRLLTLTHQELFDAVENVVEKRLTTEIAPLLRFYRDRWNPVVAGPGFYPFRVPFMNPGLPGGPPSRDLFCGVESTATDFGLLPVSEAASCMRVIPMPPNFTDWGGSDTGTVNWVTCNLAPPGQPDNLRILAVVCDINYTGGPSGTRGATIDFTVLDVATTLAVPIEEATAVAPPYNDPGRIRYGPHPTYPGPTKWGAATQTFSPASGNLSFTFSGTLPPVGDGVIATVTVTFPLYSAQTRFGQSPTNIDTSWFFDNEWYRNTLYAVVHQRLPNGAGTCTLAPAPPTPPGLNDCLTVLNPPVPGVPNNKEVVLVLAGRSGNGVARPTGVLADYFELENDEVAGTTLGVFERRPRSNIINDKVVVVAPCTAGASPCP
jgi:hypothetical protein